MWVRFPLAWFIVPLTSLLKLKKRNRVPTTVEITYKLNFKSLLPLYSNINLHDITLTSKLSTSKLLVKQSYLLLMWLSFFTNKKFGLSNSQSGLGTVKFYYKPSQISKYTITKAPMAHKTFSQEQYLFKFFSIDALFKFPITSYKISKMLNVNSTLYLNLLMHSEYFFFETNLFFLHKFSLILPLFGKSYFTV